MKKNERVENAKRIMDAIEKMNSHNKNGEKLSPEEVGSNMAKTMMDEMKKIIRENKE